MPCDYLHGWTGACGTSLETVWFLYVRGSASLDRASKDRYVLLTLFGVLRILAGRRSMLTRQFGMKSIEYTSLYYWRWH